MNHPLLRAVVATLCAATLGLCAAPSARADLVTYELDLLANTLGPDVPVFGLSSLPGAPLVGHFTLNDAGWAPHALVAVDLIDLDLWVGNAHLRRGHFSTSFFTTDAGGHIDINQLFLMNESYPADPAVPGSQPVGLYINAHNPGSNFDWAAVEGQCSFDTTPPYTGITAGRCIGGLPGSVQAREIERHALPEPPLPALLLLAVAAAGTASRRRLSRA